jgi:hypothetical protein
MAVAEAQDGLHPTVVVGFPELQARTQKLNERTMELQELIKVRARDSRISSCAYDVLVLFCRVLLIRSCRSECRVS